ncbi:MAG: Rieske 2Fe-2S domain-containing protein [Kibdelosporangium sp.]
MSHEPTGSVLVLDPAGPPVHGDLPATWRELRQHREVVWHSRGEDGFWAGARAYLDDASGPVDIVAAGAAVAAAMALGQEHSSVVRSVLLVDPAAGEWKVDRATARAADEEWQRHEEPRIQALTDEGVHVRVIAHSWEGDDDRTEPPLPLGHPTVVATVRAALPPEHRTLANVLDLPARWRFLDKPATLVQDAIRKMLPSRAVRDVLHGTKLGHPLHPALVQFPIGMFTAGTILDFVPGGHRQAGVLIGLGVVSSVPAALAGSVDYADGSTEQRRVGLVHAALNVAGLAYYMSSLWSRIRGHRFAGTTSALMGLALTGASAALGGHLAFRYGMGANHADEIPHAGPDEWTDLGPVDDYPMREPERRTVGDVSVVVVRDEHQVHVLADRCSHAGGPLSDGEVLVEDGLCIECPWHGSVFRLRDGDVVHGPATAPQPLFDTQLMHGHLHAKVRTWS